MANNKIDDGQLLVVYAFSAVLLPLLYYVAVRVLEYFAISSVGGRFIVGLVLVFADNAFIFMRYASRYGKNALLNIIATSNLLALLMVTPLLSCCYLVVNKNAAAIVSSITEKMSFWNVRLITDVIDISQNIPFINLGLLVVVVCTLLFAYFWSNCLSR